MRAEYLCPSLTFFKENGEIDFEGMHHLYDRLIAGGLDGIVVLGSTGEFYSLSINDCERIGLDAVEYVGKRVKVYVGTGRPDVKETTELSEKMIRAGADGVIIIPPYYIGASEEGFYEYYHQAATNIHGDILIYNYPDRTGFDISPEVIERLLKIHKNIIGIKDTAESAWHTQKIIERIRPSYPNFKIYSGYDNNFLPVVMSGGDGCIAALSNIAPDLCAKWVLAVKKCDFDAAGQINKKISELMSLYNVSSPFIPSMKRMLMMMGLNVTDRCNLPVLPVGDSKIKELRTILEKI